MDRARIVSLPSDDADRLVLFDCLKIPGERLHHPGADWVGRVFASTDRPVWVLRSLQTLLGHGWLSNAGYLSTLPVDQGIEHSAGAGIASRSVGRAAVFETLQLLLKTGCLHSSVCAVNRVTYRRAVCGFLTV